MIGSAHEFASGNWRCYEKQLPFEWKKDEYLTGLVMPPELENTVLLFRRVKS
jgi:hypothetical protein